jgi:ubiquinone/menaquinone biosynthesis C-methylase UbiE
MTIDQALLKPGESLLDVGCGTGGVTIPGKKRVGQDGRVAGIDPSPEMLAVASQKAGKAGLEIDSRFGVIESLPYPDATFDVVTSSLTLKSVGFFPATRLDEHFRMIGFVRAVKPIASQE